MKSHDMERHLEEKETLRKKVGTLLKERDGVNHVLEAAVGMGSWFAELDRGALPQEILKIAARISRTFVPFRYISFYLIGEDGLDFDCAYSDSEIARDWLERELDYLIEDGTVAWALGRNKPVVVSSRDEEQHIMLHSLTTPNRIMGLFLGDIRSIPESIMDVAITFFSVVQGSTASVLLNTELYREVVHLNEELREKVVRLQKSEQAADAANKAKDVFLANVSHEVRTPLNGILGIGELLLQENLPPSQMKMAATMIQEGRILLHLINDILDISKIESGSFMLETIPFSLKKVVYHIDRAFTNQATAKGLQFQLDFIWETMPPLFMGDPLRIRQIMANLVSNAIKFTAQGSVTLGGGLETHKNGRYRLSFFVRDTGKGMTEEEQKRIFSSFSQANPTIARTYGGTGLGLSISHRLAEIMDGTVEVQSVLGKGSSFIVRIWLGEAPEDSLEEPLSPLEETLIAGSSGKPEKPILSTRELRGNLLVVDDSETNLMVLSGMLTKLGYTCTTLSRGEEVLPLMEQEEFDMVFLDIRMEGMDGVAVKNAIRSSQVLVNSLKIPLIAVTANAMSKDKQRYLDEGFNDYLAKPVSLQELAKVLQTHFPETPVPSKEEKPEPHAPILDYDKLIDRLEGDRELGKLVLESFTQSLQEMMQSLKTAEGKDPEQLGFYAHKLRGGARNAEAPRVALEAEKLEEAVQKGSRADELRDLVRSLEKEVALFLHHMKSSKEDVS